MVDLLLGSSCKSLVTYMLRTLEKFSVIKHIEVKVAQMQRIGIMNADQIGELRVKCEKRFAKRFVRVQERY